MPEAGHRIDIGKYKCVIYSDGTLATEGSENEDIFGLNCLLINFGDQKILIDTGCGNIFQSTAGKLAGNMEAEGIKRTDIDRIIFTHGHIDHVGGSFDSHGKCLFPNARFITSGREWKYWETQPGNNELQNMFFSAARKNLLPIRDRFDLVKDNVEVLPGIKLIKAPGHTPGTILVDISSDGKRLLCIGDIVHSQLEFAQPEYLSLFDVTPEQALNTRDEILSDAAKSGVLVFACHFPFPGLGYIKRNEGVFAWQPI
jgi:glyoxylase-like metal-dependent hydrolase (beta-lactamase superfamily II)